MLSGKRWLLIMLCTAASLVGQTLAAPPPGVIIDRSPDPARVYIGSPSIAVLPNGDFVASHDFFGPGTSNSQTAVFTSNDSGATWKKLTRLDGQWWSTLFVHRGDLYILGTTKEYGSVVIRRSTDGGRTWSTPKDGRSGLLLGDGRYHCAPVPVVVHKGRIWRAVEFFKAPWGKGFCPLVISAPVEADLLCAESWTASNHLDWGDWPPHGGWLEGNVVVTPDQRLVNILRVQTPGGGKAARVQIADDGKTIRFDPAKGFIDMPGGVSKFTIRYDEPTKRYWSLVNKENDPPAIRNILALVSSADLEHWTVRSIILRHLDSRQHAWQYVDWLFAGDDLIVASRTAWDGSHNFHDANYLTFHRVKGFRRLTMQDSPPYLVEEVACESGGLAVQGHGFRIATLKDGQKAYGNRPYVWNAVPERFRDWKVTQTDGAMRARITVKAHCDGVVYVATATSQKGIDMSGWRPVDGAGFHYTDAGKTKMCVFQREIKAGQEIVVPQGNWSGALVLLPQ